MTNFRSYTPMISRVFNYFYFFQEGHLFEGTGSGKPFPPLKRYEPLWLATNFAAYITNKYPDKYPVCGIFFKQFPLNYFFVIFSLAYVIENNNKITNKKKGVCNCDILNGLIISDGKYIGAGFACCVCIVFAWRVNQCRLLSFYRKYTKRD